MQSRISFFNRQLFRKNLTRFWPLWAMPSFVGALFPLAFLVNYLHYSDDILPLEVTQLYYEVLAYGVPIISLIFAVLVAAAVWSYLFSARSVGMMHTLPIRREGLFLTNFLSGMAMMLIPYVVVGALCILLSLFLGAFDPLGALITILGVAGESLFYFASATLVCFITGNIIAMPVLYFIFHFLAVGLDALVCTFAQGFLFGVTTTYTGTAEFLSPTVYLMQHVREDHAYLDTFIPSNADNLYRCYDTPDGYGYYSSELTAVTLENGWLIAVYALVGVVLLYLAWALYNRRRSESAGDVVSVGWMKPVFRYGVTFCAAMLGGLLLYSLFWSPFQNSNYFSLLPMILCMLVAGIIGYYAASMLLAKSLRVFRGSLKGLGLMAVGVVVISCVLHFDLMGAEKRVPEIRHVESVRLNTASNSYYFYPGQEDELLEQVRELHAAIAADKDYIITTQENRDWAAPESSTTYVNLRYTMRDGTVVTRRYSDLPIDKDRMEQPGTYDYLLDQLINGEAMRAKRLHMTASDPYQPSGGYLYVEKQGEGYSLNDREAAVILEAVALDAREGTWGTYDWFETSYRDNRIAMDLSIEFMRTVTEGGQSWNEHDNIGIQLRPEMRFTRAALLELGLVKEEDFVTYFQLYPEDYSDEEKMLYAEKYGYIPDAYETVAYDPNSFPTTEVIISDSISSSVGVIGGADGPTQVYVTGG